MAPPPTPHADLPVVFPRQQYERKIIGFRNLHSVHYGKQQNDKDSDRWQVESEPEFYDRVGTIVFGFMRRNVKDKGDI
jgi:hypothetical protein